MDTYTCSRSIRPKSDLVYEHMFSPADIAPPEPSFFRHAFGVLRAFLLLEDDYAVDWNLDRDEPSAVRPGHWEVAWEGPDRSRAGRWEASEGSGAAAQHASGWDEHPHRAMLRRSSRARRPGTVASSEQVCLCPVGSVGRPRAAPRAARVS